MLLETFYTSNNDMESTGVCVCVCMGEGGGCFLCDCCLLL